MWSFIAIFVLVLVGLVLLTQPAVARYMDVLTMLSALLVVAFWASLLIWLALLARA